MYLPLINYKNNKRKKMWQKNPSPTVFERKTGGPKRRRRVVVISLARVERVWSRRWDSSSKNSRCNYVKTTEICPDRSDLQLHCIYDVQKSISVRSSNETLSHAQIPPRKNKTTPYNYAFLVVPPNGTNNRYNNSHKHNSHTYTNKTFLQGSIIRLSFVFLLFLGSVGPRGGFPVQWRSWRRQNGLLGVGATKARRPVISAPGPGAGGRGGPGGPRRQRRLHIRSAIIKK